MEIVTTALNRRSYKQTPSHLNTLTSAKLGGGGGRKIKKERRKERQKEGKKERRI